MAAYEDLQAAVNEYRTPIEVGPPPPRPKGNAAIIVPKGNTAAAETPQSETISKAQLAAKDKAIQVKDSALASKDKEIEAMREELRQANLDKKDNLDKIIDGAKAQGVCVHLLFH